MAFSSLQHQTCQTLVTTEANPSLRTGKPTEIGRGSLRPAACLSPEELAALTAHTSDSESDYQNSVLSDFFDSDIDENEQHLLEVMVPVNSGTSLSEDCKRKPNGYVWEPPVNTPGRAVSAPDAFDKSSTGVVESVSRRRVSLLPVSIVTTSQIQMLDNNHERRLTKADVDPTVIGEMASQLNRRILAAIFKGPRLQQLIITSPRICGTHIQRIPELIDQEAMEVSSQSPKVKDAALATVLTEKFHYVLERLACVGYDYNFHPGFSTLLVEKYGVYPPGDAPSMIQDLTLDDVPRLRDFLQNVMAAEEHQEVLTLLECLELLATDDEKPLFIL